MQIARVLKFDSKTVHLAIDAEAENVKRLLVLSGKGHACSYEDILKDMKQAETDVTDYAQYGLDDPEAVLHLATEERSYDIKMGAFSKMDEQRYIDIGDGNVYLVGEDPIDYS